VEEVNVEEGAAVLDDRTAHHVRNVLRLGPGEMIELRDGRGRGWRGLIWEVTEGKVRIRQLEPQELTTESPLELTLGLAFARSDRMDLVLRQATEIGITRFVAFKITHEAVCQCGRLRPPEILVCKDVSDFLSEAERFGNSEAGDLRVLAAEEGGEQNLLSLWKAFPIYRQVLTVVGPEGGWTPSEMDQFLKARFHPVHLGPRTLRFETAATVLLSSVQMLWGDFGQPV
jgi:16S rRNA (uracil1498-N3)-methyltransferase